MKLDDLEIELRRLPGVRAAGFTERDDVLLVQLHIGGSTETALPLQATRIAHRHSEGPVAVELVRWRTIEPPPATDPMLTAVAESGSDVAKDEPAGRDPVDTTPVDAATVETGPGERRVRLLAVLTFPDTDELEVHLTLSGRRTIGRAPESHGPLGAVEATLDALRGFSAELTLAPTWAQSVDVTEGEPYLVACQVTTDDGSSRHGIASGASPIEAAARASLHALNRTLARALDPLAAD